MKALDHHFHRAQNLLRGNTLSRQPVAQKAAAPIFNDLTPGDVSVAKCGVQIAGINAPTNAERLASYVAKRESARTAA